jgi:hypothetical protein
VFVLAISLIGFIAFTVSYPADPAVIILVLLVLLGFLFEFSRDVAAFAGRWFGIKLAKYLLRIRTSLIKQFEIPVLTTKALICKSRRDEAYLYLLTLGYITFTPFFIWSVVVSCTRGIPFIIVVLILAMCRAPYYVTEPDVFVPEYSFFIGPLGIACLYPLSIIVSFMIAIVPAIMRGNPLAFGWTGFLGAALLDVRPSPLPFVASNTSVRFMSAAGRRDSVFSLIHSGYYSDLGTIQNIISFIKDLKVGEDLKPNGDALRISSPLLRFAVCGGSGFLDSRIS